MDKTQYRKWREWCEVQNENINCRANCSMWKQRNTKRFKSQSLDTVCKRCMAKAVPRAKGVELLEDTIWRSYIIGFWASFMSKFLTSLPSMDMMKDLLAKMADSKSYEPDTKVKIEHI